MQGRALLVRGQALLVPTGLFQRRRSMEGRDRPLQRPRAADHVRKQGGTVDRLIHP